MRSVYQALFSPPTHEPGNEARTNLVSYPDPLSTLQGRSGNETRSNPEEWRKSRGRLVQLVQLNDQSGHPLLKGVP